MPELSVDGTRDSAVIGRRNLDVGGGKAAPALVYDRDRLPGRARFVGPAIVEEATATTVVLAGQSITIDRFGLILIEEAA
jgi:N-methylhydantoinase A